MFFSFEMRKIFAVEIIKWRFDYISEGEIFIRFFKNENKQLLYIMHDDACNEMSEELVYS